MSSKIELLKEMASECESGNGPTAFDHTDYVEQFPNIAEQIRIMTEAENKICEWADQYWKLDEDEDDVENISDI